MDDIPADREILVWGGLSYQYLPLEFRDYWKNGWNGAIGYGLSFTPGAIGYGAIFAALEYNRFAFDEAGYRAAMTEKYPAQQAAIQNGEITRRGTTSIANLMVFFKGSFSATKQSPAPYFLIGAGLARLSTDSIAIKGTNAFSVSDESQTAFTWSAGLGVEIPVTAQLGIFIQGRTVIGIFDRTRQYFPVSGGIKMKM
jgi:opacity protein-like surface antigen